MLDKEKSIFIINSFVISVVLVLSILSKFSLVLSIQISTFLMLLLMTIIFINSYKFKINIHTIIPFLFLLISVVSCVNADFKVNVINYILILFTAVIAGLNFSFLPLDFKKKVFFVPIFISLWLSMILFTNFISNPKEFFYDYAFYDAIALNINVIAGFLVLVFPLFFIFIKDNKNKNVYISIMIFVLFAIFLTKSRVAIAVSMILTLIFLLEYRKNKVVKFLMFFLVISLITSIIYISSFKSVSNSVSERLVWWQTAFLIFKENILFGCGIGNYTILFKAFRPQLILNTSYAYNIILQMIAEIGIVGFISFLVLLGSFYSKVIDRIIEGTNIQFYISCALSVTAFLVVNLFDYSFYIPANMLMFFIVLSAPFFVEITKIERNKFIQMMLLCVYVVVVLFCAKPIVAQIHYKKGIEFYISNQYKMAIEEFDLAIKFDKNNPEYYTQNARAYFALYDKMRGETGQLYADKSIEYTQKAIMLYEHSSQLWASLAYIYFNNDKKEEALKAMEKALKYDKYNPNLEEEFYQLKNS